MVSEWAEAIRFAPMQSFPTRLYRPAPRSLSLSLSLVFSTYYPPFKSPVVCVPRNFLLLQPTAPLACQITSYFYSAPLEKRRTVCDKRACLSVCLFVCLHAYLRNRTSELPRIFFACYSTCDLAAGSSSGGVSIRCHVLPVLWMTSCFTTISPMGRDSITATNTTQQGC